MLPPPPREQKDGSPQLHEREKKKLLFVGAFKKIQKQFTIYKIIIYLAMLGIERESEAPLILWLCSDESPTELPLSSNSAESTLEGGSFGFSPLVGERANASPDADTSDWGSRASLALGELEGESSLVG